MSYGIVLRTLVIMAGTLSCVAARAEAQWEGEAGVRRFTYQGFTGVEIGGAFDARIDQGAQYAITVYADERDMDRVFVRSDGRTLEVGMNWWPPLRLSFLRSRPRIEIVMPRIERIGASGASRVSIRCDAGGDGVDVELSGASEALGSVRSGSLRLEGSGASRAELSGGSGRLTLSGSGASRFRLMGLEVGEADVRLSGASRAEVVTARLAVDASGASGVLYRGDPVLVRIDMSGGSWIRRD